MSDFHKSAPYQRLQKRFRAVCAATNARCHICIRRGDIENSTIDYISTSGPWTLEVDHLKPVQDFPELLMVWENLAASHKRCNRQRGTRDIDKHPDYQGNWVAPDW